MSGNITEIVGAQFEAEVLQAEGLVLLDIWGDGCAPCKALAPVLEKIAAERGGSLKVVKAKFADATEVAVKLEVMGLPSLYLFRDGEQLKSLTGLQSKPTLDAWIDEV